MRALPLIGACLLVLAGCGAEPEDVSLPTYNIDMSRISTSGVSSGAYMAGQLHVAYSDLFVGAGLLAGGPYDCAGGDIERALGPCLDGEGLDTDALVADARAAAEAGAIPPLAGLADDPVWVFHSAVDPIVDARISRAAAAFYAAAGADVATEIGTLEAAHGFPTLATGAACGEFAEPYLNACDYDAAGRLLEHLHGPLEPRGAATGELLRIPQPSASDAEMRPEAFLYVPAACAAGEACGVHVALHGCSMADDYIGDAFAAGAGYNEWAETNRLVVLYPQVATSTLMPLNPRGCWDWWGYTGDDYATRSGAQVAAIVELIEALSGTTP